MSVPIKIYNDPDISSNNPVVDLDKATDIQYNQRLNEVWTASFSFPADNEKNDLFDVLDYAEIYDGEKRIGLFRIDEKLPQRSEDSALVTYECSHVLDTLNDDYIAIQSNITDTGAEGSIRNTILPRQDTPHWEMNSFEFTKSFEYEFNRQTLLRALLDIPQPWWEDWQFTFDTTVYPWKFSIVKPNTTPAGTVRYGANLANMEKEVNAKELITELYAFGEGSGRDQVSVGPLTSNTGTYGTVTGIWEEQYFDNESDLETAAQKYLNIYDTPLVKYRVDAADLYNILDTNEISLGDYITVYDNELDIDESVRVVEARKSDVTGEPGRLRLELANKSRRFPNYGALAFKDEATEENLASGSVGSGALAGGSVGSTALGDESVSWDKVQFKTDDGYFEQTLLNINAIATFENNFTEIDKLDDGTTYAKMRKDWRSSSDVTKIAGGEIYTDSITLDAIYFSPVLDDEVIASIEASTENLTISYGKIDQDVATENNVVSKINLNREGIQIEGQNIELDGNTTVQGTFTVEQGNIIVNEDIVMDESGVNSITGAEHVGGAGGTRWTFFGTAIQPNANLDMGGYEIQNIGGLDISSDLDMGSNNITGSGLVYGHDMSFWSETSEYLVADGDLDTEITVEDIYGAQHTFYPVVSGGSLVDYISF